MASSGEYKRHLEDVEQIFKDKLSPEQMELYLKLEEKTIDEYREIFNIFDETGDGTISNDEIGKVMEGLGERLEPEEIDALIAEIDYDNDGEVDFDEFVCLMVKTINQADKAEEELVMVFNQFDVDGNGEIDARDLEHVLNDMGYGIDLDEAEAMINFFDKDGDGNINFAEFIRVIMYDTTD